MICVFGFLRESQGPQYSHRHICIYGNSTHVGCLFMSLCVQSSRLRHQDSHPFLYPWSGHSTECCVVCGVMNYEFKYVVPSLSTGGECKAPRCYMLLNF